MTKTIKLGDLTIPVTEYATQGNAFLGIRKSGKSYSATGIAEQLLDASVPFVAFDPIGVWRNLKVPGKGKGYKVVVAHPSTGDLPLTPESAPEIVRAAMRENIPLVIDLYAMELSKADWRRIVEQCARILLHENGAYGMRHIFIEEAAEFVPQRVQPEQGKVYAVLEQLSRMGGNAQLGYTLINQRAEAVNKEVLENCDCLFLHRQKGKNSLTSLGKWLDFSDKEKSREIISSLPTLPAGTCWVWSSGAEVPVLVKMPEKNSFHPDRTNPKASMGVKGTDVSTFVQTLTGSLQAFIDKAKENDPAELRKRIAQLEKQLKTPAVTITAQPKPEIREVPVISEEQMQLIRQARTVFAATHEEFMALMNKILKGMENVQQFGESVRRFVAVDTSKESTVFQVREWKSSGESRLVGSGEINSEVGNGGLRRMLVALAQRQGLSARQLGVRAGLSSTSGSFGTYLARGRTNGWIEGDRENLSITAAGKQALGSYEPLPEGKALLDYWLNELGESGASRILRALANVYPRGVSKEVLGDLAGMSSTSGSFGTYLSKLRTLELIEGTKEIKASGEFFQ